MSYLESTVQSGVITLGNQGNVTLNFDQWNPALSQSGSAGHISTAVGVFDLEVLPNLAYEYIGSGTGAINGIGTGAEFATRLYIDEFTTQDPLVETFEYNTNFNLSVIGPYDGTTDFAGPSADIEEVIAVPQTEHNTYFVTEDAVFVGTGTFEIRYNRQKSIQNLVLETQLEPGKARPALKSRASVVVTHTYWT